MNISECCQPEDLSDETHTVSGRETVRRDVDAQRSEGERKCRKESSGAIVPMRDQSHGIPFDHSPMVASSQSRDDADEGDKGEEER